MGNSAFPLLKYNPTASIFACDFSKRAVELVKAHPEHACGRITAAVADITEPHPFTFLADSKIDVCTTIFVLSAIAPGKMPQVRHPRGLSEGHCRTPALLMARSCGTVKQLQVCTAGVNRWCTSHILNLACISCKLASDICRA